MRRIVLLLAMVGMALALSATAAFAAIKIGTNNAETIVGTNSADHITGNEGNDFLDGRAGNDVYHFADWFGQDTLVEPKKVGALPGGTDTVSFAGVTTASRLSLIPQWRAQDRNQASTFDGTYTHSVTLNASIVEKVVGGSAGDIISTGAGSNTLKGGAGGSDRLSDYGGWNGGSPFVGLPASNDTYKGFAAGPGFDVVEDFGGTADILDLRPWESSDVYFDASSVDSSNPSNDSLIISAGDRGVYVYGHLAPIPDLGHDENSVMEKIIFADETITSASRVRTLVKASPDAGNRTAVPRALAPQSPEDLLK